MKAIVLAGWLFQRPLPSATSGNMARCGEKQLLGEVIVESDYGR